MGLAKKAKKTLLVALALLFLCLASLAGAVLYLYHHPSKVKPLVERSLSRVTGTSTTLGELSFGVNPLRVSAGAIRMNPPEGGPEFQLDIPSCDLTMGLEGVFGRKTLVITRFQIQDPRVLFSRRGSIPPLSFGSGGFSPSGRILGRLFALFFFRDIRVEAGSVSNGAFLADWGDGRVDVRRFSAAAASTHPLEIGFGVEIRLPSAGVVLSVPSVRLTTENAFSIAEPVLRASLTFQGANLHSPDVDAKDGWGDGKLLLRPAARQLSFDSLRVHLRAVTAGQGPLRTPRPLDLDLVARGTADLRTRDLEVPRFHIAVPDILVAEGAFKGVLGGKPRVEFTGLNLALSDFKVAAAGRAVKIQGVRVAAPGARLEVERKTLLVPSMTLKSALCGDLRLNLQVGPEGGRLGVRGENTGFLNALRELHLLPAGWRFGGEDFVRVEAGFKMGGGWSLSGGVGLSKLEFEGPDPSWIGEGISLRCEFQGKGSLEDPSIEVTSNIEVEQGELLFDRFYFDLGKNRLTGSWQGRYDTAQRSLRLSDAQMVLRDLAQVSLQGSLDCGRGDTRLSVSARVLETPVNPLFQQLVLGPFKGDAPFLQGVAAGGDVSLALKMDGRPSGLEAEARLTWREGSLSSGDRSLDLKQIELDLPIWYRKGKGRQMETGPSAGALEIGSMSIPPLPRQPLKMALRSAPNRLYAEGPTVLKVPGGEVEIGPVALEKTGAGPPSLQTSLSLEDLDLQPLLSRFWPRPVQGSLSGRLDPVRLEGGVLSSRGRLQGRVFGGEVALTRLGAAGVLSGSTVLALDADWEDLSLSELTRDTSFGRIQGLLRGHVRNLEIAHAEPQRFELLAETVQKKGVSQNISVTAVENIARIGGGQSPFLGIAGAVSSLFREFSYQKIGVRASLANDVFNINGTVRENGVEYLVKKGGFAGVNIVNQNPHNRISFKDMVKRIQRVVHSDSGPVVR